MAKPIPEGYHSLTPALVFKDSAKAIEFYKKAFDAQERDVMTGPGGRGIIHAELQIGDSRIMMTDENPHMPAKSAETLGGSPIGFYVYVNDVDSAFKTAQAAGAKVEMAPQDMFWGDRMASLRDPFGYAWSLATRKKDLSREEIAKAAEAFYAEMAKK